MWHLKKQENLNLHRGKKKINHTYTETSIQDFKLAIMKMLEEVNFT